MIKMMRKKCILMAGLLILLLMSLGYAGDYGSGLFGAGNYGTGQSPSTDNIDSGESESKKTLSLSEELVCNDDGSSLLVVTLTSSGSVVSSVRLVLSGTSLTFSESGDTDLEGVVSFDILSNGDYKLRATKSGYYPVSKFISLDIDTCEAEEIEEMFECELNEDCQETEYCLEGSCVEIQGECGYAENHEWVSYECCLDWDCEEGFECIENVCMKNDSSQPEIEPGAESIEDLVEEGEEPQPLEELEGESQVDKGLGLLEVTGIAVVILIILIGAYILFNIKKK